MSHLDKFAPDELAVAEFQNWIVTVRGKQVTLGDLVVLPRAAYKTFSDVDAGAAAELFSILGNLEEVATTDLGADRINVVAAMMKDPFVHFHFFPRFEIAVERFGRSWVDEDWPRAITLRDVETSPDVLSALKSFYSQQLGSRS